MPSQPRPQVMMLLLPAPPFSPARSLPYQPSPLQQSATGGRWSAGSSWSHAVAVGNAPDHETIRDRAAPAGIPHCFTRSLIGEGGSA